MKLRDETGKFIKDTWNNRIKVASSNDKVRIGIVALIVVLALYEMA